MPIRRVFELDCSPGFVEVKRDLYKAAEEIMEYVEQEYREFCVANGIVLARGTRVTA